MLEETYLKIKKNILPKMKKTQPNFQEPVIEYCKPEQVIDICSYNHYPVINKTYNSQKQTNNDNDIYDTLELQHEIKYGIYEDVLKTEELMAEFKRIDEAEKEMKEIRDIELQNFPLEQFSDAGKVANEGDPRLKLAADIELYNLEKRAIQTDINNNADQNASDNTEENSNQIADENSSQIADENSSHNAEENSSQNLVSHVQQQIFNDKYHVEHDDNTLCKTVYGPTYIPKNESGQKILLPQITDMSHKDNLKLLYNTNLNEMCNQNCDSLEQGTLDSETFNYAHIPSAKHVLVQGVYVGSASPLIADIKTEPYSLITYTDDGMLTGTYDNTHDIPIYVDNGTTLNIMPTHYSEKAYYLHHLPKENAEAQRIHTGNGPIKAPFLD